MKNRATDVLTKLKRAFPEARCSLDYRNPLELLIATILSAQCTDERVNIVTKGLFKKYRTAADFAAAAAGPLERLIRSSGFYRTKAKNIRGACAQIVREHRGRVPDTMDALNALPGVGRKTANVVLGNCFDTPGITVDTHVGRISRRLGWTRHTDPVKVEYDLMKLWPKKNWTRISHTLIQFGRKICAARRPDCPHCPIRAECPWPEKTSI